VPLVAGVASSIAATRVEIRDADDGQLVATARAPHPLAVPPRSVQSPLAWWDAFTDAIQRAGTRDIVALSVAAQPAGLVCLDRAGAVVHTARLWNDTESQPEADALVRATSASRWAQITGAVPTTATTVAKVAWLARHDPDALARTAHLLVPHDYLVYRLTGRPLTDRANASLTGYWSPGDERWRPDILAGLVRGSTAGDWLERLPEVVGAEEPADWMSASVHEPLGLRGRPLIAAGATDLAAAALVASALEPGGEVVAWVDEATAVAVVADDPTSDETGAVVAGADATGRFLPHVLGANGLSVIDEFATLLALDAAGLSEAAMAAPASADGVVVVPHFDGERWPHRPAGSGALTGLRRGTSREAVARAVFDALGTTVADGIEALVAAGAPCPADSPIVLVGAASRLAALRRAVADGSGRPVIAIALGDVVAMGAAVQAAAVHHDSPPAEVARAWAAPLPVDEIVEPRRRQRKNIERS
jgi:xylulokinase